MKYHVLAPQPPAYTGLNNFRFLVNDMEFWNSLRRSLAFSGAAVTFQTIAGFGIALLLKRGFRGMRLFHIILCMPLAIPPIAVGAIWRLMLVPGVGIAWYWLKTLGITFDYSTTGLHAWIATVVMDGWHWLPFSTLVLLAGIVSIPPGIVEAADLDGASGWKRIWHIVLPMIKYELLLVILMRFTDAFKIFDEVWMMTMGGPGSATRYMSVYVARLILTAWDMGYGATMSVVFFIIAEVFAWVLFKVVEGGKGR
jgi:multiple sugar transport system permease protein